MVWTIIKKNHFSYLKNNESSINMQVYHLMYPQLMEKQGGGMRGRERRETSLGPTPIFNIPSY